MHFLYYVAATRQRGAAVKVLDRPENIRPWMEDESKKSGTADRVFFPETEAGVREILQNTEGPVTVQGGLTGVTAGAVPDGGIVINLSGRTCARPIPGSLSSQDCGSALSGSICKGWISSSRRTPRKLPRRWAEWSAAIPPAPEAFTTERPGIMSGASAWSSRTVMSSVGSGGSAGQTGMISASSPKADV